ncbi:hypothetical protein HDU96_003845 [Phlyctochytrium bullatum]|nr:hypothetical protein HDU96_003845 [Phlyctochytrium bullatum]
MSSKTSAGIVEASDGTRIIPQSRRADGTVRKERKVRPGYVPAEDVERYSNSRMEAAKLPPGYVVGMGVVGSTGSNDGAATAGMSKSAKKNAKRRAAKQQQQENGGADNDEAEPESAEGAAAPASAPAVEAQSESPAEVEKKLKALKKKLRQIQEIEAKDASTLVAEQKEKLAKKGEIEASIKQDMAPVALKTIAVIGGTGAQGIPIVEALSSSSRYKVRVVTRNTSSGQAVRLASLPNVEVVQGQYTNEDDVRRFFNDCYGAYVNTDGFSIGEREELFWGFRLFEIAAELGVKHYIYGSVPYATKWSGYKKECRAGHMDAKGRIAEWILAQKGLETITSVLMTTAYIDMLYEGFFVPQEEKPGQFVFNQPLAPGGKISLIALQDIGYYCLYMFDHPQKFINKELNVSSCQADLDDFARAFNKVLGPKHGYHARVAPLPYEAFMKSQGVPKDAAVTAVFMSTHPGLPTTVSGKGGPVMSFWENFEGFFNFWSSPDHMNSKVDYKLLDSIHPGRIRSIEEWMEKVGYDAKPKKLFKNELLDSSFTKVARYIYSMTREHFDAEPFDKLVKLILSDPINWNGLELPVAQDGIESAPQAEVVKKLLVARMVSQFLGYALVSAILSASMIDLFAKVFSIPADWMAKNFKGEDEIAVSSTSSDLVKLHGSAPLIKPFTGPEKHLNIVEASGITESIAPVSDGISWNGSEPTECVAVIKCTEPLPVAEDEIELAPQAEVIKKFIVAFLVSQLLGYAMAPAILSTVMVGLFAKALSTPMKWDRYSFEVEGDLAVPSSSSSVVKFNGSSSMKPFTELEKPLNIVGASGTSECFAPVNCTGPNCTGPLRLLDACTNILAMVSDALCSIKFFLDEPVLASQANQLQLDLPVVKSIVSPRTKAILDTVAEASESGILKVIKHGISPEPAGVDNPGFLFSIEFDRERQMAKLFCQTTTSHVFLISAKIINGDNQSMTFRINVKAASKTYEYGWEDRVTFPVEVLRALLPIFEYFEVPEFFDFGSASSFQVATIKVLDVENLFNTIFFNVNGSVGASTTSATASGIVLDSGIIGEIFKLQESGLEQVDMPSLRPLSVDQFEPVEKPSRTFKELCESVSSFNEGVPMFQIVPWKIEAGTAGVAPSAETISDAYGLKPRAPASELSQYRKLLQDVTLDAGSITALIRETFPSLSAASLKIADALRPGRNPETVQLEASIGLGSAHLFGGCLGWLRDVIRDTEPIDTVGEIAVLGDAAKSVAYPTMLLDAYNWDRTVDLLDRSLRSVWGETISQVVDEPEPIAYQPCLDLQGAGGDTDAVQFLGLFFKEFGNTGNLVAKVLEAMQDGADQTSLAVAAEACRRCAENALEVTLNQIRGRCCFTESGAQEVRDAVELIWYPLGLLEGGEEVLAEVRRSLV